MLEDCVLSEQGDNEKGVKNALFMNAVAFVQCHYSEDVSLKDMACAAYTNPSTLTETFKCELGTTPIKYLWWYRIEMAKRLLVLTSDSVKNISKQCGFKTVSHFCKLFESYNGITPRGYRKMW